MSGKNNAAAVSGIADDFKQVAPEIWVCVSFYTFPPDTCLVLMTLGKQEVFAKKDSLLIFSDTEIAENFLKEIDMENKFIAESFSWDDLVEKFGKQFQMASLDQTGKPGFFASIPIHKVI